MSAAKPMAMHERLQNYWLQTGNVTPRQWHRAWRKFARETGDATHDGKFSPTPRQRKRRAER